MKDLQRNTRDGLHIASLAGAWIAAVAGFGGMRDHYRHPPRLKGNRKVATIAWTQCCERAPRGSGGGTVMVSRTQDKLTTDAGQGRQGLPRGIRQRPVR